MFQKITTRDKKNRWWCNSRSFPKLLQQKDMLDDWMDHKGMRQNCQVSMTTAWSSKQIPATQNSFTTIGTPKTVPIPNLSCNCLVHENKTYVDVCQAVHPLPNSFSKSSGTISCPFRRKVRTFTSSIERYFLWHPKTESTSISAGYPFATKQLDYLTFLPGPTPSSKCHWNLSCAILCIHTITADVTTPGPTTPPQSQPSRMSWAKTLPQTKQASWKTHFFTGLWKTMAPYSSIRLCPLPSQQKCRQFWSPQCTAHHPTQTIALGVLLATNWSRYSGPSWPH